ncbi:hypothetical protein ACFY04_28665 [Streptomyces sp. NPDC001549]|uniref:hypothetical protein n=1 Tax=Streptomyces sp. NPDC001549 TaxID=3364586 RepID=UPI003698E4B7
MGTERPFSRFFIVCGVFNVAASRLMAPWMPAPAVHCRYIGEWVATKHRWGLAADRAEREALPGYAAGCPNVNLAFERAG